MDITQIPKSMGRAAKCIPIAVVNFVNPTKRDPQRRWKASFNQIST